MKSSLPIFAGAALLLIFAIGFTSNPGEILNQAETSHWPRVTGTISELIIPVNAEPGLIRYSYVVEDQRFEASRNCRQEAVNIELLDVVSAAKVGDAIDVFVSPDDPRKSVLVRGVTFSSWLSMLCSVGSVGFLIYGAVKFWMSLQTEFDIRSDLERAAMDNAGMHEIGVQRVRFVPVRLHPLLIGFLTTVVYSLIFLGIAIAGDWAFQIWTLRWNVALIASVSLAMLLGVYDWWHTKSGNDRGRWDLVIDRHAGRIQLPALSAWSEPTWVNIADVVRLSVERLLPSDHREVEAFVPYKLVIHYREHGYDLTWRVTSITDRRELEVLAEWIADSIGLENHAEGFAGPTHDLGQQDVPLRY